jgi:hypothetical protein
MEQEWRSAVWLCGVGWIVDLRVKNGSDGREPRIDRKEAVVVLTSFVHQRDSFMRGCDQGNTALPRLMRTRHF